MFFMIPSKGAKLIKFIWICLIHLLLTWLVEIICILKYFINFIVYLFTNKTLICKLISINCFRTVWNFYVNPFYFTTYLVFISINHILAIFTKWTRIFIFFFIPSALTSKNKRMIFSSKKSTIRIWIERILISECTSIFG